MSVVALSRGVYRGDVDATCVQFGSRGKEFHPQGGKNSPRYMGHKIDY